MLEGKGTISHVVMEEKVRQVYERFEDRRKEIEAAEADKEDMKELEQLEDKIKGR